MSEPRRCPQCAAELAADSPAGLCPECLLKQGLHDSAAGEATLLSGGFVPPSPEELARHFPQLEVLELLGKGGMGAVYKARQRGLDRLVALKILPPEVGRDPAFAERFTREARALARLGHPNIVTVYDFGRAGDLYYFLMEYVDGTNLRDLIQTGELAPQEALAVVPQICEALQFAHDEGIVHRDIKPENILIDKRGRVKIADFGLAKLLGRMPTDVTLTQAQQVMGTLHYMAPEQMQRPLEVDHRADIYSLGVVFYEMLTRELPLGRFEPPSRKAQIDVRLDEVVMRSLEQQPERRYQHASDVKSEVETICGMSPLARQRIFGQEYRSRTTIAGWPLLHIAFGIDPRTGKKRVAKGVIALGDIAVGGLAFGGVSLGGIAFGGVAAGLITSAGVALGLLAAVGGLAVGGFSFGGLSVGVIALGGQAVGLYAYGGSAFGLHAMSSTARDPEAVRFFEPWADNWSAWLASMGMVMPIGFVLLAMIVWLVLYLQQRHSTVTNAGTAAADEARCVQRPKTSALERAGQAIGSCWHRAVGRFPNVVRGVLLLVYLLCFCVFFSSSGSGGPGFSRVEYTIGQPLPWYEFQFEAGKSHHMEVNLLSPAWLVALAAFGILHLLIRVRSGDVPVSRWELPRTHAIVWGGLAFAGVAFGPVAMIMHAASAN